MNAETMGRECQRLEEDLENTMVAHWQMATVWRGTHWALGVPATIAGILATASAAKVLMPGASVVFACLSAVLVALVTFVNPQKLARDSHGAGVRSSALRAKVRRFREIDLADPRLNADRARKTLEALATEKAQLQETTPHTGGLARWLAQRSLKAGHTKHAVDALGCEQQ